MKGICSGQSHCEWFPDSCLLDQFMLSTRNAYPTRTYSLILNFRSLREDRILFHVIQRLIEILGGRA